MSVASEKREIKKWLRDLRDAKGWSQADVGEMLGVSRETIGGLENEKKGFANGFTLVKYLKLLGVLSDEAPAEIPGLGRLAALEEKADEALAGIADILALLARGEGDAGAREESP